MFQFGTACAVTGNFDYNSSVSNMLNDLKWMNINQRFTYFLGILVYKWLNNLAPDCLSSNLKYVSDSQPYFTRTAINKYLRTPKPDLFIIKQFSIFLSNSICFLQNMLQL